MSFLGGNRIRNIIIVVGLLFVLVLLIGGLSSRGPSGPSNAIEYQQFLEDELGEAQADVTVSQMIDPWSPDLETDAPPPGRRYVALEVTLENPAGSRYPHYAAASLFKLGDSADFAYSPVDSLIEPALTESLELAPGERTRGWVMFEIEEEHTVESLYYWTTRVALPR
jgi:hypothetical protein